jgi:hypothetical protein
VWGSGLAGALGAVLRLLPAARAAESSRSRSEREAVHRLYVEEGFTVRQRKRKCLLRVAQANRG